MEKHYFKSFIAIIVVVSPLVLLVLAAGGFFGSNVQELVSDLCLTFTSSRHVVYNR